MHFHARARLVALMLERLIHHRDASRWLTIGDFERLQRATVMLNDIWKQRDGEDTRAQEDAGRCLSPGDNTGG